MSASLHNGFQDAFAEQNLLNGLMRRLKRRKLLITAMTAILFMLCFVGIQMLPKSYRGVASVAVEGQTPTPVQGAGDVLRDQPFDDQTMGTELAILKSRELLSHTITQNGLTNRPEFNPTIRPSGLALLMLNLRTSLAAYLPTEADELIVSPSDRAMAETLETLRKHITLSPLPRSRVIEIAVTANQAQLAATIANTIADLYKANHRDYKLAVIREAHEYLDAQIGKLQIESQQKADALERYRIEHGLTTAMTATLLQEQVSGLSNQLQAARALLAEKEGQAAIARKTAPTELAAVLASPTITKLREQEGLIGAEQGRLIAAYGPNSPMLSRVNAQLQSVRNQIAAEAQRAVKSLPNDVASIRSNVDSLTQRLNETRAQARTMDEARARLATLEVDANASRSLYNSYLGRLRETDAQMAYSATNVRVISHAAVPIRASFPPQEIMLPAALVLSFVLAGLTAYATTRPKGIGGSSDIELMFGGVKALGMIPLRSPKTIGHFDSAIEQLLNRLIRVPDRPRSILITSALPQEGKTTTAQALAEAAQSRGMHVVLVDADLRSMRVMRHKLSHQIGLSDVLRGDTDVHSVTTHNPHTGVMQVPAGSPRGNPTRLMALPTLGTAIGQLTAANDLVIIDAPPTLVGGDCEVLAQVVDTTVMLAKWGSTAPETVSLALKMLDTKVAGLVLTMVDPAKIRRSGQSEAVLYRKELYNYYK